TTLTAGGTLEIYNTATPDATAAPIGFTATSRPAGEVRLSWTAVDQAETYSIYRSSGACGTPGTAVTEGLVGTQVTDLPAADGTYCYAVAALRRGAESPLSTPVQTVSDRVPPPVPDGVAVALAARGVGVTWTAPGSGELPARYRVYRNGGLVGTVAGGRTGAFSFADHPALGGSYAYAVASADAVGNENRSAPVAFDLLVGAVTQLEIFVDHGAAPLLGWQSADPSAVGYNVYRGGFKLNAAPLATPAFEDQTYAGSSRVEYAVRAVNGAGQESPPRTAWVYPVALGAASNPDAAGQGRPLVARYFNQLRVTVTNGEGAEPFALERVDLRLTAAGVEQYARAVPAAQALPPGGAFTHTSVVAVAATDQEHLLRVVAVQVGDGGTVSYRRHFPLAVSPPGVMVDLKTRALPLAGGFADLTVCTTNLGYADLDLVVSRANGAEPGDLYVAIQNAEGLELSRGAYTGFPPGTRVSAGVGTVTLVPGQRLCVDVRVLVPEALADGTVLTFTGVVEKFRYPLAGGAVENAAGLTGTMQSGITFAEYSGTASADRDAYANNDLVTLTGRAVDRATGLPRPNVALKLGFLVRGYKWYVPVTTDGSGEYSYAYRPSPGLSGEFTVWAAHPDVYDSIDQDRFTLYRLYATPARGDIRSSRLDTLTFRIGLLNPGGAELTGFTGEFRAYTVDALGNEVAEPLVTGQAVVPPGFALKAGEKRDLDLQLTAALDAPGAVQVEYTLTSAEGAVARLFGSASFAAAVPVLSVASPVAGYVDLSLDRGKTRVVSVTVKNQGLRDLLDAELTLPRTVTWMTSNLPRNAQGKISLGTIPVGGSRTLDVIFTPPATESFGYHRDKMVITGSNAPQPFDLWLYAQVTSDQTGSVLFKVINMLGIPVEGATVRMRNTALQKELAPVKTDAEGRITVSALQEGDWSYQIQSPGHSTVAGVVTVVANQAVEVEAFPTRSLVTIKFTVEPVLYTDRYEIKIEQTFETHVPVPVLVVEPPVFRFENVQPGFEAYVTMKASNKGLIRLTDLTINGTQTARARLEPLVTYLPELGPMESVDIPFRITYTGAGAKLPGGALTDFADCATGGFLGLGSDLEGLAAAFAGRGSCYYTDREAGALLGVAATGYAMLRIMDSVGKFTSLVGAFANLVQCAAAALGFDGFTPPFGIPLPNLGSLAEFRRTGPGEGGACFAPGTPILMADGSQKAIETVEAGDRVLAFDGSAARVTHAYVRETDHLRELRYRVPGSGDGELRRLETTDEHLFWADGKGWTPARLLREGDRLVLAGAARAEVVGHARLDQRAQVYNLDVENYRAYFANGALAHQRCGGAAEEPMDERLRLWAGEAEQPGSTALAGREESR
ncbi:MAG: polymorphic toxin-type HINT domain-containing protein, partial [Deferrisomatales bacterium]